MTIEIIYCTECEEWTKVLGAYDLTNIGCSHTIFQGVPGSTKEDITREMPDEWEWREP